MQITRTHDLYQYATLYGPVAKCFRRHRKPRYEGEYVEPRFIDVVEFKSELAAKRFKKKFDQPIKH